MPTKFWRKRSAQQKALDIIDRLTATLQVRPFDFARKADASQILNFIQNENSQTIALVLSYLQAEQASQILLPCHRISKRRSLAESR